MEVIVPLGVPRSISLDSAVAHVRAKFQNPNVKVSSDANHREFPDPRLFDFDQNGTVDASDIIQERQIRQLTQAAVHAKTPLSKYTEQVSDEKSEVESGEQVVQAQEKEESPKISIFA